jgi:hypothetical protein
MKKEVTKEETKKNSADNQKGSTNVPKLRQIIIETNGNDISLVKAEVHGKIELIGILQSLITYINQQK